MSADHHTPLVPANPPAGSPHDFAFLNGHWHVRHRKLKARLVGCDTWLEFAGSCHAWELLEGSGNVDDNRLEDPTGPYRAITLRRLSPLTGLWNIWWFDQRFDAVGVPMQGGFQDGVGTFLADERFDGRCVKVRFIWSAITPVSARWEQAFSADGGESWETNWVMLFERAA
ncbi:DUF1579 domain-containing protein [Niveispirillum lacus]|uniref:DUF1579 domain-containing protein n=2 Tax=Niveispirillum lacus TaxID=1981099 RepID=A0A255YRG5_9PROT|nr:DUF1579 domain-containing protein [Niveispirillum lacus]